MASISREGNREYPSIPEITEDTETHTVALQAIKEALETHERRSRNIENSFIRFSELVDLGIINSEGDFILEIPEGGGGGAPVGTTDGAIQIYDTGGGAWVEEPDIFVLPAVTGNNNAELHFTGNNSVATTVGMIQINAGNSGSNVYRIHDGSGQGFVHGASFTLSSSNHTMHWESFGVGASSQQPLLELEQDGWVHMHNRNVRFNLLGTMNLEENAVGSSMTGLATMGQFWVQNTNPNNPRFTNGDGSPFDLLKSDGTTGGAGSAGAGNQYIEIEVGNTTYKVLHDGTV